MPKHRPQSNRRPRNKFYIYCEGEKTEPNYIRSYIDSLRDGALRDVVKVQPTTKNTPMQLVDVAVSHKRNGSSLPGDVFWVVYDRESVAKYSDELHDRAFDKASANKVNIALSNVCFELWLLLHFLDSSAPYSSYEDLIRRSQFRSEFKRACGKDYEKNDFDVFGIVSHGIKSARVNAAKLNSASRSVAGGRRTRPHHLNPYTDMHLLLDAIDKFR